jgi:hypothetical protein
LPDAAFVARIQLISGRKSGLAATNRNTPGSKNVKRITLRGGQASAAERSAAAKKAAATRAPRFAVKTKHQIAFIRPNRCAAVIPFIRPNYFGARELWLPTAI